MAVPLVELLLALLDPPLAVLPPVEPPLLVPPLGAGAGPGPGPGDGLALLTAVVSVARLLPELGSLSPAPVAMAAMFCQCVPATVAVGVTLI